MHDSSAHRFDRAGGIAGIVAVLLLVSLFTVFPSLPAPNKPIDQIVTKVKANRDGLLLGAYTGALMTGALLVFGASITARLRRAAGTETAWWLLTMAGLCGLWIGIAGNALEIMFVRAIGHGVAGNTLWLGYGGDHWLSVLSAIPLAVFLFGAGMGGRATGVLRRWLAWLAITLSGLFLLGAASVTGDEVDGGILGAPLLLAYIGLIIWILGVSLSSVRPRGAAKTAAPAPAPAPN
jgi:hypothetical protein